MLANIDLTLECAHLHSRGCFFCAAPAGPRQIEWPLPLLFAAEGGWSTRFAPLPLCDLVAHHWDNASRAGFDAVAVEIDDAVGHEPLVLTHATREEALDYWDPFSQDWPEWCYGPDAGPHRTSPQLTLAGTAAVLRAVSRGIERGAE